VTLAPDSARGCDHRPENLAVGFAIEILRAHEFDDAVKGVSVEQNTAQDRFLGVKALRGNFFEGVFKYGHDVSLQ